MGGQPALAIRCRDPSEFITSIVEHHRGEPVPSSVEGKTYLVFIGIEDENDIMGMIPNTDEEYEAMPRWWDEEEVGGVREQESGIEVEEKREVREGGEDPNKVSGEDRTLSPALERFERFPKRIRVRRWQEVEPEGSDGYIGGLYDIEQRCRRLSTYDIEREEGVVENEDGYEGEGDESNEPHGHDAIEEDLVQMFSQSHIQPQEHEDEINNLDNGSNAASNSVKERYRPSNSGEGEHCEINEVGQEKVLEIPDSDEEEVGSLSTNNDSPQISPRWQPGLQRREPATLVPQIPGGVSSSPLSSPPPEEEEEWPQAGPASLAPLLPDEVSSVGSTFSSRPPGESVEEPLFEIAEGYEHKGFGAVNLNAEEVDGALSTGILEESDWRQETNEIIYGGEGGPCETMDDGESIDDYCTTNKDAPKTPDHHQFVLPIREFESPIRPHPNEISPLTTPVHSSPPPKPDDKVLDGMSDEEVGDVDDDESLLYPSNNIETLVAAEHVEIIFIPDLQTFQVFLETLQYTPIIPPPSPPLLAIWGLVGAHYKTDEFGGEGIGCTLGLAVEAAEGSGRLLVLGEGYVDVEYDDARDWEGAQEMCWMDIEVPILNRGSMIVGKTVVVKNVIGKWCRFGEDLE